MADYYPLIARAVAALDENTGDARRALYERARGAGGAAAWRDAGARSADSLPDYETMPATIN